MLNQEVKDIHLIEYTPEDVVRYWIY